MNNQILELLNVSLKGIKDIIDVNTIIGEAIKISEDLIIIPISKVKMGFITGGTEINAKDSIPFGGGTGGTVNICPVAFLITYKGECKLLHFDEEKDIYEKLIENIPSLVEQLKQVFTKEV